MNINWLQRNKIELDIKCEKENKRRAKRSQRTGDDQCRLPAIKLATILLIKWLNTFISQISIVSTLLNTNINSPH